MNILAIAKGHNASTALLIDGKLAYFAEEERLTRRKYDGVPLRGIIEASKLTDTIDELVLVHTHSDPTTLEWTGEDIYPSLVRKLYPKSTFTVTHMGGQHHLAHAACAYWRSPFHTKDGLGETVAIVVIDGAGSRVSIPAGEGNPPVVAWEAESIYEATPHGELIAHYQNLITHAPIGTVTLQQAPAEITLSECAGIVKVYEAGTQFAGWSPIEAGKLMGLAPLHDGPLPADPTFMPDHKRGSRDAILPHYPAGASLAPGAAPTLSVAPDAPRWADPAAQEVASKVQHETQRAALLLVEKALKITGARHAIVVGGYGLNCTANAFYEASLPEVAFYFEPLSNDAGTSLGGAAHVWYANTKTPPDIHGIANVYSPTHEDRITYADTLRRLDVPFGEAAPIEVASLLAEQHPICLFRGGAEMGPRALGNRSILYDPRDPGAKDALNRIKGREPFRPFAGVVLAERANRYLDEARLSGSRYMLRALPIKPEMASTVPGAVHVDGTCRAQILDRIDNPHLADLLEAWSSISGGCDMLINTSFNLAGEPMVHTLADAVASARSGGLPYLYLPEVGILARP